MSLIDSEENQIEYTDFIETAPAEGPLIYCGPALPRGLLAQYTVYRNGLPEHLEQHFESCPAIKRLFVPVGNFSKTLILINEQGSAESVWFKQVLEYRGGAERGL